MIALKLVERLFGGGDGLKKKLIAAAKRIDGHKHEVTTLRLRLESRRQALFEQVVRAIEERDDNRASVYAVELSEVKKVLRVVRVSELALTQIIVRLQSIRDVGDVFANMTDAFKIMKGISKSVSGVVPALESATEEVHTSLSETLVDLGNLSPSISLDVRNEGGTELFEKAKLFAEEKAMESKESIPSSIASASGDSILEKAKKVALLATGEGSSESEFQPTLLSKPGEKGSVEEKVLNYINRRAGHLNILEAAAALNLPVDEVEKTIFKLVSEGRLKLGSVDR